MNRDHVLPFLVGVAFIFLITTLSIFLTTDKHSIGSSTLSSLYLTGLALSVISLAGSRWLKVSKRLRIASTLVLLGHIAVVIVPFLLLAFTGLPPQD